MREGVGDTLRKLHRALRPDGILLDLHPVGTDPLVEVEVGGRVTTIGRLVEPPLTEHVHAAEAVLAEVVAAGRFVPEQSTTLPFIYHFDGVESWLDYMRQWWAEAIVDPEMVARARALLTNAHGEVRVCQTLRATRLRRA